MAVPRRGNVLAHSEISAVPSVRFESGAAAGAADLHCLLVSELPGEGTEVRTAPVVCRGMALAGL